MPVTLTPLSVTPVWEVSCSATATDGRRSDMTRRFTEEPTPDVLAQVQTDFQAIAEQDLPDPKPEPDPALVAAVIAAVQAQQAP